MATIRKRLAPVLVAGLAAFAPATAAADVNVFACEPEWAALASEIGGDDVTVFSATHAHQDPHFLRARPSLIAQVRRAGIVFCSGAELEVGWLPVLMDRGAGHQVQPGQPGNIMAAEHVEVLERPEKVDRSLGDIHPSGNPHVHLDPRNIALLAVELTRRLTRVDPENAAAYRARLENFQARWSAASERWRERAGKLRGMKIVVHHATWVYLVRWAGLERVATLERVPGVPPTASHLRSVVERVRKTGAVAILHAPYEPRDAVDWLSERTGLPVVELPYTVGGEEDVGDLFALFDVTLALLEKAHDRS